VIAIPKTDWSVPMASMTYGKNGFHGAQQMFEVAPLTSTITSQLPEHHWGETKK